MKILNIFKNKEYQSLQNDRKKRDKRIEKALTRLAQFHNSCRSWSPERKHKIYDSLQLLKENNYLEEDNRLEPLVDRFYSAVDNLSQGEKIAFDLLCQGFGNGKDFPQIENMAIKISKTSMRIIGP